MAAKASMHSLNQLETALCRLPGIGPRAARRIVFYLLKHQRQQGLSLADCLKEVLQNTVQCSRCNQYTRTLECDICADPTRNAKLLCVVELPSDLIAIEQSRCFNGYYFVLMGKISPIDGLNEEDLKLPLLLKQVQENQIEEVILALSPSVEGQITSDIIAGQLTPYVKRLTRPAQGIPSGSELECLDSITISNALKNRALFTG